MREDFCRTLVLLRKDKGVSQRAAATALGISQALLSHYEKGAREPGLNFVTRACDYYGVSADFLLGRTMLRDGALLSSEDLHDAENDKDNRLRGSVAAVLHKKLLMNSMSLLFDLLGRAGDKVLIETASSYLGDAVYVVFRHLYSVSGDNPDAFFSVREGLFSLAAGAEMARREAQLSVRLHGPYKKGTAQPQVPAMSYELLLQGYPQLGQSLLMLLQQAGERMQDAVKK